MCFPASPTLPNERPLQNERVKDGAFTNGSSEGGSGPSSFEQRLAAGSNRGAINALAAAGKSHFSFPSVYQGLCQKEDTRDPMHGNLICTFKARPATIAGQAGASQATAPQGTPLNSASQFISVELSERNSGAANAQLEVCSMHNISQLSEPGLASHLWITLLT